MFGLRRDDSDDPPGRFTLFTLEIHYLYGFGILLKPDAMGQLRQMYGHHEAQNYR